MFEIVMLYLLHTKTIPRTSREGLEYSLLVVRESCVVAFDAGRQPAFGEETVAVDEVVG